MFGMCVFFEDLDKEFFDYGIILCIENVSFLFDGCFIVEIMVVWRFCVVFWLMIDGYNIVKIKWFEDEIFKLYFEDLDF